MLVQDFKLVLRNYETRAFLYIWKIIIYIIILCKILIQENYILYFFFGNPFNCPVLNSSTEDKLLAIKRKLESPTTAGSNTAYLNCCLKSSIPDTTEDNANKLLTLFLASKTNTHIIKQLWMSTLVNEFVRHISNLGRVFASNALH